MSDGRLAGPRVLVIEDDPEQAAGLEDLLRDSGFAITGTCSTIGDALDQVRANEPALAVVDLNLDGESAAPVLLELEAAGVPCVVMAGGRLAASDRFRDLQVLRKPLVREDLLSAMQRLLWRDRAEAGFPGRHVPSRSPLSGGARLTSARHAHANQLSRFLSATCWRVRA
jgi:DNA-binding response OmpR family regulator